MSNTRKAIRQEVAKLLQGPHLFESTASANLTANLVILSDYLSTLLQNNMFVGNILYVSYDAAGLGGAPEGEYRRIASYLATTGTFTMDGNYTAAVTTSDKVEIHTRVHPVVLHDCIDRALRKMLYPTLAVPSLMADADMEASGTTSWTAAAGATLAKNTTAANVFRGAQSLSITADAGADDGDRYCYQRFNVMAGDIYYVFAACRNSAAATQCKLQAYDVTNGAEIESKTSTQMAWGGLGFSFTIPASCEQVDIRLHTPTASGISYWDHVGLFQQGGRRYALPSWVTEKWQVGRLVYQLKGSEFVADTAAMDVTVPVRWEHIRVKKEGATVYIAPDPPFNYAQPIYLECLRPYSSLSADSSTCDADLDWLAAKTKLECLRMLATPQIPGEERKELERELARAEVDAAALDRHFAPKIEHAWGFGEESLWAPRSI